MHRFVTEEKISGVGEEILLGKEESAHASKVLRLRHGEPVQLIDGENRYDAVLTDVSAEGTRARVTALCPSPEATAQAVLWQGLPKADKLELIAQKATELGAWEIWPVEMLRSVARLGKNDSKKQERLSRIALEAAKQSGIENDAYRLYGKAKRHDIHQIGKHGVSHGLVKSFGMSYCNVFDCIHILNSFIYVL